MKFWSKNTTTNAAHKQHSVFENSMKKSLYLMWGIAFVAVWFLVYFIIRYMTRMADYDTYASSYIPNPINHQLSPVLNGETIPWVSTVSIFDMLDGYISLNQEETLITDNLYSYRIPFNSFLRFLYLPSLNVWKDPFVDTIDTTMMGSRFLEKNPYTDISLINQWTDFFKYMGSNTYNEIDSIVVNELVEEGQFFYIPIQVSFTAPSRRAFLFLLDKLSLTSDKNNIMLVNEFFYHLWESIQASGEVAPYLEELSLENNLPFMADSDSSNNLLAYALMHWKEWEIASLPFLTEDVLRATVRSASWCRDNASQEVCEFQFREKFRSIPRLAYTLWSSSVSTEDLLTFLSDIPPLIVLENFTFEKQYDAVLGGDASYEWSITMKVYGSGIADSEVSEIGSILGNQCFGSSQVLSIWYAQSLVQKDLLEDVDPNVVSLQRSKDLLELQGLLSTMDQQYEWLTNYQKIIKLFETYRMLDDALFCE